MDLNAPAGATVHVVDDDEAVRTSIRFLLELESLRVQTYHGADALLDACLPVAGCVLTDFNMPGIDGLQLQERLTQRGVGLPVIVMTGHADVPMAVRALKAGAVDFLEKPFRDGELLAAVRSALARNAEALRAAAAADAAAARIARLTGREREVFDLLVDGRSNKDIARALGTSPRTIEVHRARVLQKLEAGGLPDLVRLRAAAPPPP